MSKKERITDVYPPILRSFSKKERSVHRLCRAVEALGVNSPQGTELANLKKVYLAQRDQAKDLATFSELELICIHLDWLSRIKEPNQGGAFLSKDGLSNETSSLIYKSEDLLQKSDVLTFRLDLHEAQIWAQTKNLDIYRRDIFEELEDSFFFKKILSEINNVWSDRDISIAPISLDSKLMQRNEFLSFMHKQLLQNTLAHALANPTHNENFHNFFREHQKIGQGDFLFGCLVFLEIHIIRPLDYSEANVADQICAYASHIFELDPDFLKRIKQKKQRLLVFSYCDTGPGVERHVRNFHPEFDALPENINIKSIIDQRLAGRRMIAAGLGLNDVRALSEQIGAKFIIETPESIYVEDGYTKKSNLVEQSSLARGTSVSIMIEV